MTETEQILNTLKQIADAIISTFPRSFEVVVHDLSIPQKSIKHIAGEVTRRKKNGPITDLVVKTLHQKGNDIKDQYNYKTKTKDGRSLKSTTSFIRNRNGDVIAAFCINFDMTDYLNAVHALEMFTTTTASFDNIKGNRKETFTTSINETIEEIFHQAISKVGKECASMSMEERINLVNELEHNGVFNIKGSIEQIAIHMGVSRYTVYNYLKKSRTMQEFYRL